MDEAIIDPEQQICDAHHHLWESWPHAAYGSRFMVDELRAALGSGHRVTSSVFVECGTRYDDGAPTELAPVGETRWVAGLDVSDVVRGIVGFADLRLGSAVDAVLDAHELAGDGRFRGVRHGTLHDDDPGLPDALTKPPPGLLLDPIFGEGVAALGRRGLTYDAWMYFHQLPELVVLARRHPEVTIVLDHLGAPVRSGPYATRSDEVVEAWRRAMRELAGCENVVVKLGAVGMPLLGFGWDGRSDPVSSEEIAKAAGPLVRTVIDLFGPDRCLFESNFPVDGMSCSYATLWNAYKRMVADLTPAERDAVFHDTATRVYRLTPEAPA